jgi:hypothetical protein
MIGFGNDIRYRVGEMRNVQCNPHYAALMDLICSGPTFGSNIYKFIDRHRSSPRPAERPRAHCKANEIGARIRRHGAGLVPIFAEPFP